MDRKIFTSIGIAILSSLLASPQIFAEADEVKDTMYRDKTAEFNYETHSGVITLENYVPGEMKVSQEAKPLDALLVLDFSGSMNDSYSNKEDFTKVTGTNRLRTYTTSGKISDTDATTTKANCFNVTYDGATYGVSIRHVYNGSASSDYRTRNWCFITTSDGKRLYLLPSGEFVEATNTTDPDYAKSTWPVSAETGLPISPTGSMEMIYCSFETSTAKTTTRILALQKAVGEFVDLLKQHSEKTKLVDRIAITTFQASSYDNLYCFPHSSSTNDYLKSSTDSYLAQKYFDYKWNGTDWSTQKLTRFYAKSGVIQHWMKISSYNATNIIKRSIGDISADGNTPTNAGVYIAQEMMSKTRTTEGGKDVARYIIVFSDGVPTGAASSSFDETVATTALQTMTVIKNKYKDAKVYSIYCNTDAISGNKLNFMERLSSNFSGVSSLTDGTRESDKYYKWAKEDLSQIFKDIAQEIIVESSSKYDVNTTLNDFVNNEYFQLPEEVDQSTAYDNILVFENPCSGYDKTTKEYSWSDTYTPLTQADGIKITITKKSATVTHDKIEISGYDYSKNWCGLDISKKTAEYPDGTPHGARLVVKIPFVYKTSQVWGDLPTNTDKSGVTVKDKETGEVKQDVVYPVPKLPFCYLTIQRQGLHKGESAIFLIEKPNSSGGYDFVDRVVVRGRGSGTDICNLYGVPGERFIVTETNWNWAYYQTDKVQDKTLDKTKEPYEIVYKFTGDHKLPDPSKSSHEQEVDPVNLHNHDEAFKVNPFPLPTTK